MLTRSLVLRTDPFAHVVNRFLNDGWLGPRSRDWASVWGVGSRLPIDIYEDGEGYTFVAVAPGLKAEDISIETQGNIVKISGETIAPALSADEKVATLRSEIGYGKFARSFELPEDIQADKIEARLESGVLTLRVPKAEAVKPRTIKVNAK
jgi:HSP20 family protein